MELSRKEISIIKTFLLYLLTLLMLTIITTSMTKSNSLLISQYLANITVILYLLLKTKPSIKYIKDKLSYFIKDFSIKEILKILLSQLGFSFGIVYLLRGLLFIISPTLGTEILNEPDFLTISNPILTYINIALIGPIFEELLFRKVFFAGLLRKHSFWFSTLISSLIFGLFHAGLECIGAFVFGIVCCFIYKKSKNILVPISLHIFNNALTGLPIFMEETNSSEIYIFTTNECFIYIFIGIIVISLSSIFVVRYFKKNKIFLAS